VAKEAVAAAIAAVLDPRPRPVVAVEHPPLASFRPGQGLSIAVRVPGGATSVRLLYRHLNQAETYRAAGMEREGASWRAVVPAEYTRTPYPLQYYFEVRSAEGVGLWPGFEREFMGQPYLVSEPS
jgi:hypothetical protein